MTPTAARPSDARPDRTPAADPARDGTRSDVLAWPGLDALRRPAAARPQDGREDARVGGYF